MGQGKIRVRFGMYALKTLCTLRPTEYYIFRNSIYLELVSNRIIVWDIQLAQVTDDGKRVFSTADKVP